MRKKLLFICPKGSLDSGGVISSYQLIQYLQQHGYTIKIVTPWQGNYNETLTKDGFDNEVVEYNWWTDGDSPRVISGRVMNAVARICEIIEEFKPSAVVTNTSHIPWGAFAASMMNVPHLWVVREYPISNFIYLKDKVHFINQYSNKVMANSGELSDFYTREYGYDVGKFMSYVDTTDLRLNDSIKETRLVSPNYISVGKNQVDLIKAAEIVDAQRPDLKIKLLLMGEMDKRYQVEFKKLLNSSPIKDRIEVLDRVEKPWSLIGEQDIMIQTSLSESIGRTTTEAMKLGVPVIASDIPGHREAFELGGGELYVIGNHKQLAVQIIKMLDDINKAKQSAKKIQLKSLETMSSDACCGPVLAELDKIIGQPNPMGVNKFMKPYIYQYVRDIEGVVKMNTKAIKKYDKDVQFLNNTIEDIRQSKSYKLGTFPTRNLRKVISKVRKR